MKTRVGVVVSLVVLLGAGLSLLVLSVSPAPVQSAPVLAAHNDTSTPFNLVSMPGLIAHRFDGRGLRRHLAGRTGAFTRYAIRYRSAGLVVTGTLLVPAGGGRFPVVVVAHGWHTPAAYQRHTGVVREDELLARHGYVVLQPDYRNYGRSTQERDTFVARPRGYPEDLINAVLALRRARLPHVERGPVALFGRSMGGGVALQALAARPHLFRAAVLYSPVSSSAIDNYRRWVLPNPVLRRRVDQAYGSPGDNPRFWRQASVRRYLSRVTAPVQVNHGSADTTCPVRWSRATARALRSSGASVQLREYRGEQHAFHARAWGLLMRRALQFFAAAR